MPKKKISRKELLDTQDEFITLTQRAINFVSRFSKQFMAAGIAVLLVAVALAGVSLYLDNRRENAAADYGRAVAELAKISDVADEKNAGDVEAILIELDRIRSQYPATAPGRLALLDLGSIYYRQGRLDEALAAYQAYLKKDARGHDGLRPLVLDSLGYIHEAMGEPEKAAARWEEVAEGSLLKEQALLNLGRVWRELEKPEKARKAYQRLLDTFPGSESAALAKALMHGIAQAQ